MIGDVIPLAGERGTYAWPRQARAGNWLDDLKNARDRITDTIEHDTKTRLLIAGVGAVAAVGLIVVLAKLTSE